MSDRNIGIKLANGQFYPILEDGTPARKRLVVTTVKDDQPSVQIDLYRGEGTVAQASSYIGSLVIENIPPRPKGEPDIRLDLSLDSEGELTASAREEASGESQSLRVSLRALSEEEKYEIPDFEFEEETKAAASTDELPDFEEAPEGESTSEESESYLGQSTQGFSDEGASPGFDEETPTDLFEEDEAAASEKPEPGEKKQKPERSGHRALRIVLIVLVGIVLVLGAGLLIYRCSVPSTATTETEAPSVSAPRSEPPPSAPAPAPAAAAPAAQPSAAVSTAPAAPPPAAEPPKALPAGMAAWVRPEVAARPGMKPGVEYKIRWGDTLWDLSYVFYRDPWLYPKIARANKIRNPNLIISGTRIWIPPR